jgi:hypothetical protein
MSTLVAAKNAAAWSVACHINQMSDAEILEHKHDYTTLTNGAGDVVGLRLHMVDLAAEFGLPSASILFEVDHWGDSCVTVRTWGGLGVWMKCEGDRLWILEHLCKDYFDE